MTMATHSSPSERERWENPDFIATQLRGLGRRVSSEKLTDLDLMKLAAYGYEPSLLELRVKVACRKANLKMRTNFSPSKIKFASPALIAEEAERLKVPGEWLRTGQFKVWWKEIVGGMTYEGTGDSGAPEFMKPYIQLADNARLMEEFVLYFSDDYPNLRSGTVKLAPWQYVREACHLLKKAKDPANQGQFYKVLPGGERPSIFRSIQSWPWAAPILPLIWEAEVVWERREHKITVSREELEWIISGLCDGVLRPAKRAPVYNNHWPDKAHRDPTIIDRMHKLYRKLYESYDCEPLKEPQGRRRKGSGRRRQDGMSKIDVHV
jgi:hypothetical protein